MTVLSLINGSLISRTSSIYAMYYAKSLDYRVLLCFIQNENDSLEDVEKSVSHLMQKSKALGVECDFKKFASIGEFGGFVEEREIDVVFSSTRHKHTVFEKSFVKKLIKKGIKADFAIVKVVKLGADNIEKIILPLREAKLSVRKFSFFVNMLHAYGAKGEIFSVEKVSAENFKKRFLKEKLQKLIFDFRHYFRILKLLNIKVSVKYSNAIKQSDHIKAHIAQHGFDLAVVGAPVKKKFFNKHPVYENFEKPIINTIYFIPYEEEEL